MILAGILGFSCIKGYELLQNTKVENEVKEDYAEINKIKYGLFNLDLWKEKVFGILEKNVDQFEIKPEDLKGIRKQIEKYLDQLYRDYFESGKLMDVLTQSGDDKGSKLGKMFVGLFKKNIEKEIKKIDFKSQIPEISGALMTELEKKIPEIKEEISASIGKMIDDELSNAPTDQRVPYYQKYNSQNIEETNKVLVKKIEDIQVLKKKTLVQTLAGLFGAVLLLLVFQIKMPFNLSMLWLGIICTLFLIMGLTLPMIDLDARLTSIDVTLMGEQIHFDEQFMYYQSKSIVDVTKTLLEGDGIDLKIVGFLILLFSIVLPFLKMLLSALSLYVKSLRNKKVVETVIFYLGKWSMADVFVVAIFMSYIGFYGLLSAQLGDISGQSQSTVETINYTKLSPGIIFFTAYCVFSIFMSVFIHRHFKKTKTAIADI